MASITALGTGSGIDLESMVTKLMDVERLSITRVQNRQKSVESEISGLGQLSNALSSIQTAAKDLLPASSTASMKDTFTTYKASVVNEKVASATLKSGVKNPATGGYSLEVEQLASSHCLVTKAGEKNEVTENGTLKIEIGSLSEKDGKKTFFANGAKTLEIEVKKGASLSEIRDAINKANGGVSATIIKGSGGEQLVLSSKETGLDNVMKISGLKNFAFDPAAADSSTNKMSDLATDGGAAAQNAKLSINGIAAESSSNVVENVLDGVSLTLYGTNKGDPTTVSVSVDNSTKITEGLDAFVTSFNASATIISDLGKYDQETGETGLLQGRAILRNSKTQLTKLISGNNGIAGSEYQNLASIGVSFSKTGELQLDSSMLKTALNRDYDGVMGLVQNTFKGLDSGVDKMIATDGTVTKSTESTNKILSQLKEQESTLNTRLDNIESRYRKQFTSLDSLVSSWNNISSYISQLVDSMNANSGARK